MIIYHFYCVSVSECGEDEIARAWQIQIDSNSWLVIVFLLFSIEMKHKNIQWKKKKHKPTAVPRISLIPICRNTFSPKISNWIALTTFRIDSISPRDEWVSVVVVAFANWEDNLLMAAIFGRRAHCMT